MQQPFPAYQGDAPYIFVSYAHADAHIVYPEISRLEQTGFNVWYDEGIRPGAIWRDEVALALTQCKVFLYFVSPRSVSSSNCLKEVNFCLSRERKILSVHLEATELPIGLELSLSDEQAIIRENYSESDYHEKLTNSLRSLLPDNIPTTRQVVTQFPESATDKSIAILPFTTQRHTGFAPFGCTNCQDTSSLC